MKHGNISPLKPGLSRPVSLAHGHDLPVAPPAGAVPGVGRAALEATADAIRAAQVVVQAAEVRVVDRAVGRGIEAIRLREVRGGEARGHRVLGELLLGQDGEGQGHEEKGGEGELHFSALS